jgi:thioredoxin-related protein
MKKTLSLLLLTVSLFAEPDWTTSFEEAKAQAKKENKNVLIMISRESCDACWYMENIVFDDEKINTLLKANFVPVYIDVTVDEVPVEFKFIGTPTFYFTDTNGTKIGHRINGAKNVKDFTEIINKILKLVKD